jgi:Domain of unknown function (DUF1906)
MTAGATSVDAGSVLAALLLFGLLGLIGQGIRAVVGLKNAGALNANTPSNQSVFSAAYLLVSLMIGFIAGVLAGIALKFQDLTKIDQSSWQQLLGIIASGYVGADFVENTMNLVIPGAQTPPKSTPTAPAPQTALKTADLSDLNVKIAGIADQVGQMQAALIAPAPRTSVELSAIDTPGKLGKDYTIDWLKQQGFGSIIRYISSGSQSKCIDADEAQALIAGGITVGIVYELAGGSPAFGGLPGSIDSTHGASDGAYALRTLKALGVPQGVVVYFAVDTDVNNNDDINTYVIPYFKAAKQAMAGYYRIGAYGCGATCAAALDSGGCDKAWLANAKDWDGYTKFLGSGRASIVQGLGNKLYDPDTIVDANWGGFSTLEAAPVA